MTALEIATSYVRRGWSPIPIPVHSKNPGFDGWQYCRLSEANLPQHFNGKPQNIGVLLGEPSGWLVDVDLDHQRCVELADEYLPATDAVFGRTSKPRSHRLYRVTSPVATKKHKSRTAGMLVELRSTGAQTVFPPSTHESGELIEWCEPAGEPAVVDPEELLTAIARLADAVKHELNEAPILSSTVQRVTPKAVTPQKSAQPKCLEAMLRLRCVDHNDGSSRLFAAACRAVEHDLNDSDALRTIREYARLRPFPRGWSDQDMLQRVRDAESRCERGAAFRTKLDVDGLIALGTRDPRTGKIVLSPKKTLPTAESFIREHYNHPERTLHNFAGTFLGWDGARFCQREDESLRNQLQPWLHDALRYAVSARTGLMELVGFDSNPTTVKAAVDSLRALTHLPIDKTPPVWLDDDPSLPDPSELLPSRNCVLHVASGRQLPPTPKLFNTSAIEFDYDPSPEPPELWIRFLEQLWGDDVESVALLQEWMGYCLVADTSQQKMLLMVGPRRSGKGTIARVLTQLVGPGNVVGPTTSSLACTFGLQPLIGKSLAIVSDARFSGENVGVVVERLLCISGEDTLTVDRKFLGGVTMKLPTRFVFLTNELPRMNDSSGALAGRFVILRLTKSFYNSEDPMLTKKLCGELPGILLWAIEGLKRLRARGHFAQPQAVAEAVRELEDLASPVGAFVRECCIVAPGERVWVDELYNAWKQWCDRDGRTVVTNKQTFGRDLAAAAVGVGRRRGAGDVPFYEGIGLKDAAP